MMTVWGHFLCGVVMREGAATENALSPQVQHLVLGILYTEL